MYKRLVVMLTLTNGDAYTTTRTLPKVCCVCLKEWVALREVGGRERMVHRELMVHREGYSGPPLAFYTVANARSPPLTNLLPER